MIDFNYTQQMTDIVHGSISYSGIERTIIGTPFFNRLHRIMQGSLVFMTFPCNKEKRFEHSVGTMYLSGEFFFHSICNSEKTQVTKLMNELKAELVNWNVKFDRNYYHYISDSIINKYKGEKVLNASYPMGDIYKNHLPLNIEENEKFTFYVAFQSIRIAGLLHDVGHLPYSHNFEEAIHILYRRISKKESVNEEEKLFLKIMSEYCENKEIAVHEHIGQLLVDKIFESIVFELPKKEESLYYYLAAVIYFTKKILVASESDNSIFRDLHRIVAGVFDCDRMDYCSRDMLATGICREAINYDRIFNSLGIFYKEQDSGLDSQSESNEERACCIFTIKPKVVRQVEQIIERRWEIFTTVNYHHRVHKHETLMEEVIAQLGLEELEEQNKVEIDNLLPLKISSIWKLIELLSKSHPIEYLVLQLDDGWLDTLFKNKYFNKYGESYLSFSENHSDVLWHRLDELISAKKHYYSFIKQVGEYKDLDEALYNIIVSDNQYNVIIKKMEVEGNNYSAQIRNGYIFNRLINMILSNKDRRVEFFETLNERILASMECENGINIQDVFVKYCPYTVGISHSKQIYVSVNNGVKPFDQYSALYDNLLKKKSFLPMFHVYYLPKYDCEHSEFLKIDKDRFKNIFVHEFAKLLTEMI